MIINKVTRLYPQNGSTLCTADIQEHIDAQNSDGYYLISIDRISGWYRFFWAKEVS